MLLDTLANACSAIKNAEYVSRSQVIINPRSKLIGNVLRILQAHGYIGEYESIDDGRFGKLKVQLLGRINKIAVIKPRKPIKFTQIDQAEAKYLPAINFGLLLISTSQGILTNMEAKKRHISGRLIAYVF